MGWLEIVIVTVVLSVLGIDLFFLYQACCFGGDGGNYIVTTKTLMGINLIIVFIWMMISDL